MLICTACGTENPAGHRFCGACGNVLAAMCPACGTPATAGFKFCGACGSPLTETPAPEPAAPHVTERRVCSVLFADLVGFTPLSESRDPEEVRELLSRYFDTARTVIVRYGGVVEKFIGDAVMAVWGTPVAAEGDAERAVRAGLDLVAAVAALGNEVGSDGLALRAGVVTGEVAASLGAIGEGMVAGDAVNTAARVQSVAAPGTVWADSATQRLAAAGVGFANAGSHRLKGKAEDVELWQATRVLSSVGGAQRVDGLEAPMTGRDAEERTLRDLFHASADRRAPRLVTVTGAAGAGKSRLGWEFEKYIDGLAEFVWWHRGRCLSYGEGVAYWALAEAVRQRFGIAAEDPIDEATAKFLSGLTERVPAPDERAFVGVRLGRLLGLAHPDDTGNALGHDDMFAGWRLFLERMADTEPVVLLIEDAQHADDALLDFVENVVDRARQSPIYLVLLGRHELIEGRPSLASGRNRSSLTLDPLDERSMRALVSALVDDLPDVAITPIVEQAQGNPLFAVETVRSLIDRDVIVPVEGRYRLVGDVGALSVPDSLHGLLAARLDALDPQLRSLVADAAVLGTSFPAEALGAVSGRSAADVLTGLTELVRREVLDVSTDPLSPERGAYLFSQNMLRQVAYDTLSRRDRRARHLAVAEHLQNAFASGGVEVMDVVAQHYLDALSAVTDDSDDEIRGQALTSLVRAGERSQRAGAQLSAARSFDRAAALVADPDPLQAARLWVRAADAYTSSANIDTAIAVATRAREIYLSGGDQRGAARTQAAIGRFLLRLGRVSEARASLHEALEQLRPEPDADTVTALAEAATVAAFGGDPEARTLADEALGLGQALGVSMAQMADLFMTQGLANAFAQRVDEATAFLQYAAVLAERANDPNQQARALNNLSATAIGRDPATAVTAARAAMEMHRLAGDRWFLDTEASSLGFALLCTGEWDEALSMLSDVLGDGEDNADLESSCMARVVLLALRGDVDGALRLAALPRIRESEDIQDIAFVAFVDATLASAAGSPDRAEAGLATMFGDRAVLDVASEGVFLAWPLAVRCALEIDDLAEVRRLVTVLEAQPIGHLPTILRGALPQARAVLAAADGEPADDLFAEAIGHLRAFGSPYHLAHGLLDHATYLRAQGRDGSGQLEEAGALSEHLGAPDIAHRIRSAAIAIEV